ncbi:hypothetical protein HYC85_012002 [Camellia sinensis]|uniref:Uncharacterized protein n=1 Tax=Camellia sinensis TaxID=4442 RepID=A0A7J7HB85_CAMSI|nr:hypothetical protein HYC85_012002 [Camellia sinensis]
MEDPQICGANVFEIYEYHQEEMKRRPLPNYIEMVQKDKSRCCCSRRLLTKLNSLYCISNLKLEFLGYYLAELSLLENDYVILLPSLVAVSVYSDPDFSSIGNPYLEEIAPKEKMEMKTKDPRAPNPKFLRLKQSSREALPFFQRN